MKKLEDKNQIALEYCNKEGKVSEEFNPNGSLNNIAGIYNEKHNILGMMPHPERMIEPILSGDDGSLFFKDLLTKK
jgi:phosphoribosylformylglycinamidine synthase